MANAGTGILLVVAAALTDAHGRVLMQRRAPGKHHAGLWEFPGGKVEPDEGAEPALARELAEELDIVVDAAALHAVSFASVPHGDQRLVLLLYRCREWQREPRPIDADALAWTALDDLAQLAMPPADRLLAEALCRLR